MDNVIEDKSFQTIFFNFPFSTFNLISAPVAELADAPDLGSGVPDVKVQVPEGLLTKYGSCKC